MIIHKNKIVEDILKIYPESDYNRILLTSEEYLLPSSEEVEESAIRNSPKGIKRVKNLTECEKYAWYLNDAIHLERSLKDLPKEENYSWAFGWCIGMLNGFRRTSHTINIAVTKDMGIITIEHSNNEEGLIKIELPNPDSFSVFWVVM